MGATEESVRRSARVLTGFMSQAEANGFASGFAVDPAKFLAEWPGRAANRALLAPGYFPPRVEDIPPSASPHILSIIGHPAFGSMYQNVEFKMVELGRLIAFQMWMDTDVSDGVHGAGSPDRPDEQRVLDKCLPLEIVPATQMQWQVTPNGVTVSSLNNTLGFFGPGVNAMTGQIAFAITPGANLMLVREHAGRYVLANGYHRAWWLRSKGVEMVPVALAHFANAGDIAQPGSIPLDVMMGPRPPVFDDYLTDTVASSVEVRSMMRVVKVTAEVLTIPRLI